MTTLSVVPLSSTVNDITEGASAPSAYDALHKRYIALARAFENVDLERTHWRRQAEQLQALIEQMKQCMKPYEGE